MVVMETVDCGVEISGDMREAGMGIRSIIK